MSEPAKSTPQLHDVEEPTLRRTPNELVPPSNEFATTLHPSQRTPSRGGVDPSSNARNLPLVSRERYLLDGVVAEGGHGRILRAQDLHLERVVALKEPITPASSTEDRFLREARITARLQHPSIVPVYEAGRWPGGEPFYAMKLVSGRSLARLIESMGSLDERLAALPHVLAVAEAMAYAHSQRVIHRDLKPSNILVGEFGETVVIDWGLAKELDKPDTAAPESSTSPTSPRPDHTQLGTILGTPAYMPPEQAAGQLVDERADVYSLGVILYHLLAGRPPYSDTTSREVLERVLTEAPTPLAQLQPRLTQELLDIVSRAMARDPAQRYPTALELAEDLRRFQRGQLVGAHRYTPWERLLRFVRRHRLALTVAAVALVTLVGTMVLNHRHIVRERDIAQHERARAEERQREAEFAERLSSERADKLAMLEARHLVRTDPDEAFRLLDSLSPSFSQWGQARTLAADAVAQGFSLPLRGHTGALNHLEFSPDGSQLVTASDDYTLRLWDVKAGTSQVLATYSDEAWKCRFSPSGRYVASGGKEGLLKVWDRTTGTSLTLKGHLKPIVFEFFTRDERTLISAGYDDEILRWDLATGEHVRLGKHEGGLIGLQLMSDGRHLLSAGIKDKSLRVWDLEKGTGRLLTVHSHFLTGLVMATRAQVFAAATENGQILLWDSLESPMRKLDAGSISLNSLALTPDGRYLAAQNSAGTLRLWDLKQPGSPPRALEAPPSWRFALMFSPDGRWLAAGGRDGKARLWEVATGRVRELLGATAVVSTLDFSSDSKWLAAGSHDGSVRVHEVEQRYPRTVTAHEGALPASAVSLDWRHLSPFELRDLMTSVVSAVAFTPDGRHVLSAGKREGLVRLSTVEGEPLATVKAHAEGMTTAFVLPDGSRLATAGKDGTVVLWDERAQRLQQLKGPVQRIDVLALSADRAWAAAGLSSGEVWLWNLASGQGRAVGRHQGSLRSLVFSPDSRRLASGDSRGELRLWEVANGEGRLLHQHQGEVSVVAFSPDGSQLASGSSDHTLWVQSLSSGQGHKRDMSGVGIATLAFTRDGRELFSGSMGDTALMRTDTLTMAGRGVLEDRASSVLYLAFSPEGQRVVTGNFNGTARIWDLRSGESRMLTGHQAPVLWVAFSPDGRYVLSASQDGTVRLWPDDLPLEPEELRSWVRDQARR